MTRVFYLPLESVKSRYTDQLCQDWMPSSFREYSGPEWDFDRDFYVVGGKECAPADIEVGSVLDAAGRAKFSMSQCSNLCDLIRAGLVRTGDVIYLQDFWTPGIEGVMYCLEQYKVYPKLFAMCHAQTFDEWDFTYRMKYWMRPYEVGLCAWINKYGGALFVASSIHKRQILDALCSEPVVRFVPIHVVGLPFSPMSVLSLLPDTPPKQKIMVFSSRLDPEKQPAVMLEFAKRFLEEFPDWRFVVTTSADRLRTDDFILATIDHYLKTLPNFHVLTGLSKKEYYNLLSTAQVQVNTSLQDYVSWTLLEASIFGCDLLYPDYRSFPECVPDDRRYRMLPLTAIHEKVESMMEAFRKMVETGFRTHQDIAFKNDVGRRMIPQLVLTDSEPYNLWGSHYSCRPIQFDEETEQFLMERDRRRRERNAGYSMYNPLPQSDEELQRRLMRQIKVGGIDGSVHPAHEGEVSSTEEDA